MKIVRIAGVLLLCLLLSACSYKNFEDQLREKIEGNTEAAVSQTGETLGKARTDGVGGKGADTPLTPEKIDGSKIHQLGEKVKVNWGAHGEMEYTVTKASLASSLAGADIKAEAVASAAAVNADGTLSGKQKLLVLELTVKNISASYEDDLANIAATALAYRSDSDKEQVLPPEMVYFSDPMPKKDSNWKDYFSYKLPVGAVRNVRVGWVVDLSKLNQKNLFLSIMNPSEEAARQHMAQNEYVDLKL